MSWLLFVVACIAAAQASSVLDLGDSDFASRLADIDMALVKFYAPWCGHCKRLAPEFDTASDVLANDDPPVALVKVDCTEAGKDTCGKYGVSGYPTLKVFKRGEVAMDYNGPRESNGIVSYMRSKAGPSSKLLEDAAGLDAMIGRKMTIILGTFGDLDSSDAKNFQKVADALSEDFKFAHSSSAELIEKYGDSTVTILRNRVMATKLEESDVKYSDSISVSAVKKWINDNVHGLVGHMTTGNQEQFPRPVVVAYYDVDFVKNPKGTNYWRNRVMKVGKKLNEEGISATYAIASANDFGSVLNDLNLNFNSDPVVAARDTKEQKFVMRTPFSMDNLGEFVRDMAAGKLEPYLKSEPIPDNDGPLKTVVGKNFDEIVNDPERDVLIEFYAPWCGHCKSLAPKYEELAEKLSGESGVTIAKMDATANDVPAPYQVQGFPTIFYAPKNRKDSPKKYEGGREVNDFVKYLAKESTDGLSGFDRSGKKQKKKTEL